MLRYLCALQLIAVWPEADASSKAINIHLTVKMRACNRDFRIETRYSATRLIDIDYLAIDGFNVKKLKISFCKHLNQRSLAIGQDIF